MRKANTEFIRSFRRKLTLRVILFLRKSQAFISSPLTRAGEGGPALYTTLSRADQSAFGAASSSTAHSPLPKCPAPCFSKLCTTFSSFAPSSPYSAPAVQDLNTHPNAVQRLQTAIHRKSRLQNKFILYRYYQAQGTFMPSSFIQNKLLLPAASALRPLLPAERGSSSLGCKGRALILRSV